MNTPSLILTILTVTALGFAPAVASAAMSCPDGGSCRIAVNHSETLVRIDRDVSSVAYAER